MSLQFGVASFVLTYLICVPLGVLKAVGDGTRADTASSVLVFIGYAVSPLMLGILLIVLFGGGTFLDWFPIAGSSSDFYELMSPWEKAADRLHHAVLPLFCYLIGNFATLTLLMKNAFLEELGKAYVVTARAKGLTERQVRYGHDLRGLAALIIPGGESSTISALLDQEGLREAVEQFARERPVMGTCAGLILMARDASDARVLPLRLLDVTVDRNGWGRQIHSFTTSLKVAFDDGPESVPAVFIRAPRILSLGAGVDVLAEVDGEPVMVRQGLHLGMSFHPELTDDTRIHDHFMQALAA